MSEPLDFRTARLVYPIPEDSGVRVRSNLSYGPHPDHLFDLSLPREGSEPAPVVVFVHGDAPRDILAHAKDWGQYRSWGELTASRGLAAVTFDHRSSEQGTRLREAADEVMLLVAHVRAHAGDLGIDADRMCLWTCSAGIPVALGDLLSKPPEFLRCIVSYYGLMDLSRTAETPWPDAAEDTLTPFSPLQHLRNAKGRVPPMLIARAGLDAPWLNDTIDGFVAEAIGKAVPLDIYTHPEGRHAFDVLDDVPRSREVIEHTLGFMKRHLQQKDRG
jgi:acetyl esterase/lipase